MEAMSRLFFPPPIIIQIRNRLLRLMKTVGGRAESNRRACLVPKRIWHILRGYLQKDSPGKWNRDGAISYYEGGETV